MLNINWKPSELPPHTVIDAHVIKGYYATWSMRSEYIKMADGDWIELSSIDPERINVDVADKQIVKMEILSVPPSWYDEWKIFSRNMPQYRINRRGEVRHISHIEAAKRPSSVTEEMVRRAFDNNPL